MVILLAIILSFVVGGTVAVLAFRKNETKVEDAVATVKADVASASATVTTVADDVKKVV